MSDLIKLIAVFVIIIVLPIGWCINVYKLTQDDFATPFKAEVVRTIGIFVPPVGMVAGYITFDEEK